ncbi:hypothetical protein KUM39_16810 [Streptomyces sp. J2-1]|uniref:hypothetical protein n=1 Tax=Streptomyces corallincola TaxID=2851888 RepID=UPI001C386A58|nr:hypothetical protein [Streptomyces corallincola]MBV2356015.1 hypothetical protein [Streptomyces corallincola]
MAHAAPSAGGARPTGTTPSAGQVRPGAARPALPRGPLPTVLDDRTHALARIAVPVVLGVIYGYWAAANRRYGGPITGWNVFFGIVTGVVFAFVLIAVMRIGPRLRREQHAALWAAFVGMSMGFLYAQSGVSVLRCSGLGLVFAAGTFIVFFYRFYTHEDAVGHRVR